MDNTPLPNSAEVMNKFRDIGKRTFYVTNNSTKTREELVKKCKCLNFKASEEEILCTSHMAADYLKNLGFKGKVYVIGKTGEINNCLVLKKKKNWKKKKILTGITKELEKAGISYYGTGPDVYQDSVLFDVDSEVKAVIVGYDEHFSYPKMIKAATYLNNPDVHFIATNTDERFPTGEKIIVPGKKIRWKLNNFFFFKVTSLDHQIFFYIGTGSIVRCIETCAERKAIVMGKPEPHVSQVIKNKYNVDPSKTLMIGDRANTDILLGTRCGFKTLLVLSGITTLDEIEKWKKSSAKEDKDLIPDYYIDTLGELLPYLK